MSTVIKSDELTVLHGGQLYYEIYHTIQGVPGSYLTARSAVLKCRLLLSLMSSLCYMEASSIRRFTTVPREFLALTSLPGQLFRSVDCCWA